jgi:hypothetical protein
LPVKPGKAAGPIVAQAAALVKLPHRSDLPVSTGRISFLLFAGKGVCIPPSGAIN